MDDRQIDEAMLEMAEFVSQMTEVEGYLIDPENEIAMKLEEVKLSIPIELDLLVAEDGSVILGSSPPLYYTETTILPVFHQLNVTIKIDTSDAGSSKQRMES